MEKPYEMDMVLENINEKFETEKFTKVLPLKKAWGPDGFLQTYKESDPKCLQRKEKVQNFTIYFVNLTSLDTKNWQR